MTRASVASRDAAIRQALLDGRISVLEDGTVLNMKRGLPARISWTPSGYGKMRIPGTSSYLSPVQVHRVVAIALIAPKEGCHEVNHLDGNKRNNVPLNLEWVTRSENNQHGWTMGLMAPWDRSGPANPRAKLSEDQVAAILTSSERTTALADRFGVSASTIRRTKRKHA